MVDSLWVSSWLEPRSAVVLGLQASLMPHLLAGLKVSPHFLFSTSRGFSPIHLSRVASLQQPAQRTASRAQTILICSLGCLPMAQSHCGGHFHFHYMETSSPLLKFMKNHGRKCCATQGSAVVAGLGFLPLLYSRNAFT